MSTQDMRNDAVLRARLRYNPNKPTVAHFTSNGTSWERTESNMNDMSTVPRNRGTHYTNPFSLNRSRFESMSNTWNP